ncbi:MAG: bifunctional hydroxymethylpyrimidine kinase/phosphomethylpyrimidine kinase [Candidatus Cloacimonetes bacterium]|nr:bifunctional hydroxymethylpyrimidine kinase/phosphomethylpyrimidine kinase [Candidatus Cloacimonadota bacterium]
MATIGAIDSSGGAGINQDIRIAALFGFRLQCCVGAITIQDSLGLKAIHNVPREAFLGALKQLTQSPDIRFVKIGALASVEKMELCADFLDKSSGDRVILDPVIAPSSGQAFIDEENLFCLHKLADKAHFICPNIPELEILSAHRISNIQDALLAAQDLCHKSGASVLLTGGHRLAEAVISPESESTVQELTEAYVSPRDCHLHTFTAHNWHYSHGTGCALATAFMCYLAQDITPPLAFPRASAFVRRFYDRINGIRTMP